MKIYAILLIIGSIIILYANVHKIIFVDREAEKQRERNEDERYRKLAERIAGSKEIESGYKKIVDDFINKKPLAGSIQNKTKITANKYASVDNRIKKSVSDIPEILHLNEKKKQEILESELKAQEEASLLHLEFEPRIRSIYELINAIIIEAHSGGLIPIISMQRETIDFKTMNTIYKEKMLTRAYISKGIKVQFNDDIYWNIYIETGRVKSPKELAEWPENAEIWYPMIRIVECSKTLGTIYFDDKTKSISFNCSDVNQATREEIVKIKQEYTGDELVANCLIELLKETKIRIALN